MVDDVLNAEQRARAAAAYEAARMVLADDPMPEDIVKVADWIVSGRRVRDVRVLPDESLIQQVVRRLADVTSEAGVGPDAARHVGGDTSEVLP